MGWTNPWTFGLGPQYLTSSSSCGWTTLSPSSSSSSSSSSSLVLQGLAEKIHGLKFSNSHSDPAFLKAVGPSRSPPPRLRLNLYLRLRSFNLRLCMPKSRCWVRIQTWSRADTTRHRDTNWHEEFPVKRNRVAHKNTKFRDKMQTQPCYLFSTTRRRHCFLPFPQSRVYSDRFFFPHALTGGFLFTLLISSTRFFLSFFFLFSIEKCVQSKLWPFPVERGSNNSWANKH